MGRKRIGKYFGFLVAIVLIISLLPSIVTAHEDSMNVIMTSPDQYETLSSGDTATVTVHVFDEGKYVDPDQTPTLLIWGDGIEREDETDKIATGKYQSTISIMDSDIDNTDYFLQALMPFEMPVLRLLYSIY